uniref:tRNA-dihydrouridine(47) synthase [NAD(P)(+)] n=1 Tax=Danio rerio TaxID=7955 RepID=Q6PEH0_DANRE|nr:tRNA-dihydrouridine(47) synthase [NAD(P)(+)]-like [Danio rerio]AAH58066.1 Zgc:63779 [Danio rerio]|eukprot:NP_956968.1 tRNA-dihydrouridine(47) synthase [NAD(P)(+)]-like [Danio rerio]
MDSTVLEAERGAAAIKSQFLTSKEKFHEFLSSGRSSQKNEEDPDGGEPEKKKIRLENEGETAEQEKKKIKMRGQNKSRPHVKPHTYEDKRLCTSIIQERDSVCPYGEKCRFLHDVSEYLSTKAADLGDQCHLFNTLGKCPYGLTCRYAKAHTSADLKNMVNTELYRASAGRENTTNLLDKELQKRLRKKQQRFPGADAFLKSISRAPRPEHNSREQRGKHEDQRQKHEEQREQTDEQSKNTEDQTQTNNQRENANIQSKNTEDQRQSVEDPSKNGSDSANRRETQVPPIKTIGPITDADIIKLRPCEKKQVDFRDKLYLAPLTTCGNLPFRRVCKRFGADITCGEMAMCTNLLQGQASEWALLKRHASEDLFGVQLEGCFPDTMTRCAELLNQNIDVDFVDINSGCPIDLVYKKGGGCGLMTRTSKFEQIVRGMNSVLDVPLTVKIRTGVQQNSNIAHKLIPEMKKWGVSLITLHGRSREQRYTKLADWDYINTCAQLAAPVPLFGNGDILSYEDAMKARETGVSGIMVARGALIKPWLFTEIKESRHWDISSTERLDILRDFTHFGLEHWGSDTQGVEKTRNFLLEWLSFLCRYIPVGLLERVPQRINERPPFYMGRDYLETLMASQHVDDWIQISEMLLGPVPKNFSFLPKHKANAYK